MTPLYRLLVERIREGGPISVADYMAECLLHPEHGYYASREPFGVSGDFTTAPEISQMFGELIGLCLAQAWRDQGSPTAFTLAEIGPGRGTMMADLLRATRGVAGFHAALALHLVEASPRLRTRQAAALAPHAAIWHDHPDTLPAAPLFLVANEFFDALPIRQFRRDPQGWREILVGLTDGRLGFGLSDPLDPPGLAPRRADTAPGQTVETCPAASAILSGIADRIARHGGAALIIDYGGWQSRGDTFQAVRHHAPADPLAEPGLADLTAHVDFAALAAAARQAGAVPTALTPQAVLLDRLGIAARAAKLAAGLSGAALASHRAAYRRLTDPAEMGQLFQALALHPPGTPPPPGFDA